MIPPPVSKEQCSFATGRFGAWLDLLCNFTATTSPWRRGRMVETYLAAVGFVAIATLLRVAMEPVILGAQFPTFYLASIAATVSRWHMRRPADGRPVRTVGMVFHPSAVRVCLG